ncbi:histidine kinase [Flavobacterium sp. U410]
MKDSPMYRFIVDPNFRLWRHLCFIITLGIITFNQVFIAYQKDIIYLGPKIYWICLASFSTYLLATYVNYFVLIPRFLVREKYTIYLILLIVCVFALLFANVFLEYKIRTFLGLTHRIRSYQNPLVFVDNLSSSVITIVCFWSMSAIELFRTWTQKKEQIIALEHQFLEAEVNKLKGQVSPVLLSEALQKASALAATQPKISSTILMQLGQLLRYQLYDCDREKVILQSEIHFISDFLKLYQLIVDRHFDYSLVIKGQTNQYLITPLLLIVLVQALVEKQSISHLRIAMETKDQHLNVDCAFAEKCCLTDTDLAGLKNKFDRLHPQVYQLKSQTGNVQLQLTL